MATTSIYTGNILSLTEVRNEQTRNTNRFTLRFYGLDNIINAAATSPFAAVRRRYDALREALLAESQKDNVTTGLQETLELSLLSLTWPKIEVERQDIFRFNDSIKAVTKFAPMTEMNTVFYDYVNGSASALMYMWHGLVGDKTTGAIGYKQDYVTRAEIRVYGPIAPGVAKENLEDECIEIHELTNLYPVDVDLGEHSYEGGEARKVTCQFAYDNFFPVMYKGRKSSVR